MTTARLLPRIRKTLADTRGSDTGNGPFARFIVYVVADHLESIVGDQADAARAIAKAIRAEAAADWS